jgi:hypothetical protein
MMRTQGIKESRLGIKPEQQQQQQHSKTDCRGYFSPAAYRLR